ncbi:MAG: DEAD/DEAH box helicase [Oscillospiraceae bacterium]
MEINFEVSNAVKRALDDMGFEKLTEIQEKAIPLILEGKDVIGKSQTGSGKTVAFGVPAIEMIDMEANRKLTQVLIMCPTRELAMQACGEFRKLTKYTSGIKTLAVYGGQPISRQIPLLRQGCQIVIGTPGE